MIITLGSAFGPLSGLQIRYSIWHCKFSALGENTGGEAHFE